MIQLQALINKFLDGNTTIQEEQELRRQLEALPAPNAEQRAVMLMLSAAPEIAPMPDSATLMAGEAEYNKVMQHRKRRTMFLRIGVPAAVAAVLILAMLLVPTMSNDAPGKALVAEVSAESEVPQQVQPSAPHDEAPAASPVADNAHKQSVAAEPEAKPTPKVQESSSVKPLEESHDLAMAVEPAIITSRLTTSASVGELHEINDLVPIIQ